MRAALYIHGRPDVMATVTPGQRFLNNAYMEMPVRLDEPLSAFLPAAAAEASAALGRVRIARLPTSYALIEISGDVSVFDPLFELENAGEHVLHHPGHRRATQILDDIRRNIEA